MALAHRTNYRQNEQPSPRHEDWNALRDELETLLEQVELQQKGRSSPPRSAPRAPSSAAALSAQNQAYSQERRQQALSSVQQAIERFDEPDEASLMPPPSQKQLQTAIDQIRASQNQFARGDQSYGEPGAGTHKAANISRFTNSNNGGNSNRIDELGTALTKISNRLERFESAIGAQQNSAQALEDMAIQVEQLSSVVELLANSVGERSQMKRLEAQISKLADVVGSGSELDFNSIDQRLEVLSGAFERMSQLQSEQWQKQENSDDARHLEDMGLEAIQTGVRNIYERLDNTDMGAIENSVRSIYDRIDTLEANMAMPLPAIERLSRELADFSKALRNEKGPVVSSSLVSRVDALNQRISQIEDGGQPVEALKIDMQELHDAVVGAMEPRFAALEDKIGALSGQFSTKPVSQLPDISVEGLEKQIHLLSEKMDQTSSELGGLQRLYSDQWATEAAPDGAGLAELVAQRTAEAVQKAQEGQGDAISLDAMAQLETRLSSLFNQNNLADDQRVFSRVQDSIEQVNKRLERLEIILGDAGPVAAGSPAPAGQNNAHSSNQPEAALQQKHHSHPGLADGDDLKEAEREISQPGSNAPDTARLPENEPYGEQPSPRHLIPEPDDRMPKAPSEEAPLNAPPYPAPIPENDRVPVPQSLRTDPEIDGINAISDLEFDETARERIETSEKTATGTGRIKLPQFNQKNIALPPAPTSSLAAKDDNNNAVNLQNAGSGQGPEHFQDKLTRLSASKTRPDQPVGARPDQPVGARPDKDLEPGLVETKTEKSQGQPDPARNGLQESTSDKVSRSTFIEAARRAAQKHNPEPQEKDNQSLIGRALARFQKKRAADKSSEWPQAVQAEPSPSRPRTWRQKLAQTRSAQDALSKKEHLEEQAIDDHAPKVPKTEETGSEEFDIGDLSVKDVGSPQSFLNKHRQPILLLAALLTVSLLTINLINQRSGTTASSASPVASDLGAGAPPAQKSGKADTVPAPLETGRPADIKTGDITGSVEGFPAQTGSSLRVIDPSRISEMPPRLNLASLNSEEITAPPLTLKLPPKAIGPMALREAAARGDMRAQFEVGAIYAEGRAIPRDLAAAARWYERAASQGFAPAAYRIGNMYENGVGVDKNLEQARLWYKLGAQGGNRMAMHNLAALLASGSLGKQRFGEAAQWFEKAAALGLKDSQFNLGMLYARGLGVKKDLATSFKWFSIAAAQGDEGAIKAAQNIARSLDPAKLASLRTELKNWVPMKMNIKANFAPIGTWSNNFDPGPAIQKRDVILQVQAVLNRIGFDTGKPDGLVGPKTVEAIDAFERAIGMSTSGQVNPRLLAVLGSQPV